MLVAAVPNCAGFQFYFTPTASVRQEYTDNLYKELDQKEHEFITSVSAGFSLQAVEKRKGLQISYNPGMSHYARFSGNDSLRHMAQLSGWADLSRRTSMEISDVFSYSEAAREDEVDTDPSVPHASVRKGLTPYYTNTSSIKLNHKFNRSDSMNLQYAHTLTENDDPLKEDNQNHASSANFTWWVMPNRLGLKSLISHTRGDFSDETDDFDSFHANIGITKKFGRHAGLVLNYDFIRMDFSGETEDYRIHNPSAGFNLAFSPDTSISLSTGWLFEQRDISEDDGRQTLAGDIVKNWNYKRGSFSIKGSSGYTQSYFDDEYLGFGLYKSVNANAVWNITRRLMTGINVSYRKDSFIETDVNRKDRSFGTGISFAWKPLTYLSFQLKYDFRRMDSTESEEEYKENRVMIDLMISPSVPFRPGR